MNIGHTGAELRHAMAIHEVSTCGVTGWLVIDCLQNGLSFGGFRFSPSVTLGEVKNLAQTMTWKLASHGLPVGGAKAGLACRPDHPRMQQILADVAAAWRAPLTECAILGKDMGATDALLDDLYKSLGSPQLALAQHKRRSCPDRLRDLSGYVKHMTGRGASWAADQAVRGLRGKRIAIQGAGLVGIGAALRMTDMGAIIVGLSDVNGAVHAPDGLPLEYLMGMADNGSRALDLDRLPTGARRIARDELLEQQVDLLVLAAGSHVVSPELAETIAAPVLIEASNFGLTETANTVLHRRGITVVPDVIASSSSAAMVAYQVASGNALQPDELWHRIEHNIRGAVDSVVHTPRAVHQTPRQAYAAFHADVVGRARAHLS